MINEFWYMKATELLTAIDEGSLTAEIICETYLARIEKYSRLNAVCEINGHALDEAAKVDKRSPLKGLPVLIKDNIDVKGMHTAAGSAALSDNIAARNAPVVDNIIKNGGVILGKTNMTEFANFVSDDMPNGYSSRGGTVINAYKHDKDPGGSSTGSAVAVSAGLCAFAVGTDTSFSVVGCATDNGVSGLKPEHRSLDNSGIVPISRTLDSAGVLARSFKDAYLLYGCMRNERPAPLSAARCEITRIAVNTYKRDIVSQNQMRLYTDLIDRMKADGCEFEYIYQHDEPMMSDIMLNEFASGVDDYLGKSSASIRSYDDLLTFYYSDPSKMMKYGISIMERARQYDERAYFDALERRKARSLEVREELSMFDACLMTGPTNVMHFTGLPSVAVKLGMGVDETPRGAILYGSDERRLCIAALLIESYSRNISPPKLT